MMAALAKALIKGGAATQYLDRRRMIFIEIWVVRKPDWLASSCPIETLRVEICDDIFEGRDCLLDGCNLLKLIVPDRADAALQRHNHLAASLFELNEGQAMVR